MTFPTVESHLTQGFSTQATSHAVDLPATVSSGDLLLIFYAANDRLSGAGDITESSATWTEKYDIQDGGGFVRAALFAKVADGTEGGTSVTFQHTAARAASAQVYRISGWEGTLASVEVTTPEVQATGTDHDPPPLTPTWGAEDTLWIVSAQCADDDALFTAYPTNYTDGQAAYAGAGANVSTATGSAYRTANASTETPGTFTIASSETWVLNTVAVRPAAGGAASVDVPAGSLTLTANAPSAQVSGNQSVSVPAASLTLTAFAPTVTAAETEFDADFERANLNTSSSSITNPASSTPSVTIVPRVQTVGGVTKHWYYFFKLTNVNGKTPSFSISESNYYLGSGGYPNPVFSYDRSTWTEFDNHTDGGTTWTFSHNTAFTSDTVYICYHYPFGMTELGAWIFASLFGHAKVTAPPSNISAPFVSAQTIEQTTDDGRTVPAQNIYAFKITDSATEPDDGYGKRTCVLFAGTHAGEDIGNYQLQGAVEYLLGGSAVANRLLKNFQFFIYPMVNPAGRWGGNFRGSWESGAETEDPNRNIATGVLDHMTKVKNAVDTDTGGVCHVFCDWHGWHGVGNYGYYGANTTYVDAFVAAIEAYTGGLTDHGTDADTWNSGYHRTNLGTEYSFTPESHHDNMDSLAEMKAYGEAAMKAMDDLFTASTFDFVDIAVPAGSLTLTGFAPSVSAGSDQSVDVPAASLSLTAFAPTAEASGNQAVDVPAGSLSLTANAPTVTASDHKTVDVPAASLTLTANAPIVTSDGSIVVQVPVGAVTLTGYAPSVETTGIVDVPLAQLTLAANAPTVTAGTSVSVPLAELTLTPFVPGVSITGTVDVPVGTITLTGITPTVSVTNPESTTPTERTLSVEAESRTLTA